MRQPQPPAGTVFLLCLNCERGEWRRAGAGEVELPGSQLLTVNDQPPIVPCRHCGGITEQRYPLTIALTEADRGLLKTIAEWGRIKTDVAAENALRQEFRRAATERAGKGKPLPAWVVEWLQNNPQQD